MADTSPMAAQEAIEFFKAQAVNGIQSGLGTEAYKDRDDLAYALSRVPMLTPRPVKIIAMGAGFAGLALARAVHVGEIPNAKLTVYEKDASIGGTWFENRYPGCCCDVPAHSYQFTWAPNPHWSSFFAPQPEIRKYFEQVADQHGLWPYVKTSHKVLGAKWIEERQKWQVQIRRTDGRDLVISSPGVEEGETGETFIEECDVFVNAGGFFNDWKWPKVKGLDAFQGRKLHSAYWPTDADKDIDGKTVAIIGNGSSGVQVLPAILDKVEKVYVHMRSPTWLTARIGEKFAGPKGQNLIFSDEQKKKWAENPAEYLKYRKDIEDDVNERFKMYMDHTPQQEAAREACVASLKEKLIAGGRQDLLALLTPDFAVGCRRPTPGLGWLDAIMNPKCEVVWGSVTEFTKTGLVNEHGRESNVDTIICATGFNLSIAPRIPIIGRNDVNLREAWLAKPEAYLSTCAADMPNYFTILGPASPLGHGSIVTSIENAVLFISTMVRKLQTENYSSVCVKSHVPSAYTNHALAFLQRTVWASTCTSTYKNGTKDGDLRSLHPGSRLQLFYLLRNPRYEDFDWQSMCSDPDLSFAFMACGFIQDEMVDSGADLSYFMIPDKHAKAIEPSPTEKATTNGVNGFK